MPYSKLSTSIIIKISVILNKRKGELLILPWFLTKFPLLFSAQAVMLLLTFYLAYIMSESATNPTSNKYYILPSRDSIEISDNKL